MVNGERLITPYISSILLIIESSLLISIGILCSFLFGLFPLKIKKFTFFNYVKLDKAKSKMVRNFFIITAFYELTQIIINNSDILLVKHYFESYEAGLYASLALIGRVVYFVAWMFVMLLLPAVVAVAPAATAELDVSRIAFPPMMLYGDLRFRTFSGLVMPLYSFNAVL